MKTPLDELNLDEAISSLKSLRIGMTDASRLHLAEKCRDDRPSPWGALAIRLGGIFPARLPAATGAMALLLAIGVAVLLVGRQSQMGPVGYGEPSVRLVKVVPDGGGGVTLEWRDGPQRIYTVLRSTDPRNFDGAKSYEVRGTRWTDASPSPGGVVYYKVE